MNSLYHPDMTWYQDARFGMFIHWGLYAIPGGMWNGKQYANEWIMNRARIPVVEYEKLAEQFNPVNFNAKLIVKLAIDTGMKYIVVTAKHHDGFAMYHSKACQYNIVDATPFKRDVIAELSCECAKQGIRFGVYYSQSQDWHHPHGAGNFWDWPDESKKDFQKYLDEKVYPQLEELLTNYGDISVLWFDTPQTISIKQAQDLLAYVRKKQPQCIVNSRLGAGGDKEWGDFTSLRDNEVPTIPLDEYAETCATLNGGWGYSKHDQDWKQPQKITGLLSDIVAKNANYLLNIGPDALGKVPEKSVEILREVGDWLTVNGEGIYGTKPSPFNTNFDWGSMTMKSGKLYCHLTNFNKEIFELYGVQNKISKAYYLDLPEKVFDFDQKLVNEDTNVISTSIILGKHENEKHHRVLCIETQDMAKPIVEKCIIQQPDYTITLESLLAKDKDTGQSIAPEIMLRGAVGKSLKEDMCLVWTFKAFYSGSYSISAECGTGRYSDYTGTTHIADTGHELELNFGDKKIHGTIMEESRKATRGNPHWPYIISTLGEVSIPTPGDYTIELKVNKVVYGNGGGFILNNLKMHLVNK